jgi:hypothetical protein
MAKESRDEQPDDWDMIIVIVSAAAATEIEHTHK